MRARLLMIGAAMVVAPALLVGCGSSSKSSSSTQPTGGGLTVAPTTTAGGTATTVNVVVNDTNGLKGRMTMVVSPAKAPAGKVTFTVKNTGTITHELIVLKTETAFDKLPVSDAGDPPAPVTSGANKVSEASSVGETGDVAKGETKSVTLDLTAGRYVLVCNIAQHYGLGMRAPFLVS